MAAIDDILDTTARGAAQFVDSYYTVFDSRRAAAANFYTANARLLWNGHAIIGKDGVTKAFQELPSTKHTVLSFDCQPVLATSEQYVLVAVTGQVTYGGDKESHTFTQTFMLVGQGNVFMINNDEFRFV